MRIAGDLHVDLRDFWDAQEGATMAEALSPKVARLARQAGWLTPGQSRRLLGAVERARDNESRFAEIVLAGIREGWITAEVIPGPES